ncbi:MAG: bacillithiol system redox-active protein YtxJ [Bacteroidota bacterium]
MGLLNNLFGKKDILTEKETKLPWIPLKGLDQLDYIVQRSFAKPQLVFKHSTTCGISRMVLQMFTTSYHISEDTVDLYFLDLHAYREISNEVAVRFQVMHESPQLLVIKKGSVIFHSSHGAITEIDLREYI